MKKGFAVCLVTVLMFGCNLKVNKKENIIKVIKKMPQNQSIETSCAEKIMMSDPRFNSIELKGGEINTKYEGIDIKVIAEPERLFLTSFYKKHGVGNDGKEEYDSKKELGHQILDSIKSEILKSCVNDT
ncbi:TPA: hypothetical protein NKB00_004386 [Vibrio parahaemolyticus]|nr:hypothetical protein [Vibrio parahaemolyticus]